MPLPDAFNAPSKNTPPYARPAGEAREILALPVYDTPEIRGFESTIEEAIFILSQSDTARTFAETAIAADYVIVIADDENKNLRGYVDHEQRLFFLAKEQDPRLLALTLGHELVHVSQKVKGGIEIDTRLDHPQDAIRKLLAMEADARAHEILIATELAFADQKSKTPRPTFSEIFNMAAEKSENPLVAGLLRNIEGKLQTGNVAPDKLLAACFKSFYGETSFRRTYENVVVRKLAQYDAETFQTAGHFQRRIDAETLTNSIDAHSTPYLAANKQHVDLTAPIYHALSQETQAFLQAAQKIRFENPALVQEAPWQAPTFASLAQNLPPARGPKP